MVIFILTQYVTEERESCNKSDVQYLACSPDEVRGLRYPPPTLYMIFRYAYTSHLRIFYVAKKRNWCIFVFFGYFVYLVETKMHFLMFFILQTSSLYITKIKLTECISACSPMSQLYSGIKKVTVTVRVLGEFEKCTQPHRKIA